MPLYNKCVDVERAVRSVLAQTVSSFELIVVNDGSTDGSRAVVERLTDPRIRIVDQENEGVSVARNRGIADAGADLIAFLDADDEWKPDFLEVIQRLHKAFPHCDVLATSYFYGASDGSIRTAVPKGVPPYPWEGHKDFCFCYDQDPPFNMSCLAVTKKAITSIGGFPPGIVVGEDLLVRMRLILGFEFAYSTHPCAVYWAPSSLRQGRAPQYPDLVGEQLAELFAAAPASKRAEVKNFIERWHRGRCIANLICGQSGWAREEIANVVRMRGWNRELYLLYCLSAFPAACCKSLLRALSRTKTFIKKTF